MELNIEEFKARLANSELDADEQAAILNVLIEAEAIALILNEMLPGRNDL
jgi:hypothetical protein